MSANGDEHLQQIILPSRKYGFMIIHLSLAHRHKYEHPVREKLSTLH